MRDFFFFRFRFSANQLLVGVAAYLALTQNFSFFSAVHHSFPQVLTVGDYVFLLALSGVLCGSLILVLSLFGWPYLMKPALALILLVAAVCSYFMDTFGVVINSSMIANAMETDVAEAGELISLPFLAHVTLFGVLPAILISRASIAFATPGRELLNRVALFAVALIALTGCIGSQYKHFTLWGREHRDVRFYINPTYPIYSADRYLRDTSEIKQIQSVSTIAPDAKRQATAVAKPVLVVLVVGETARAENFQLNGYSRETNPQLAAIDGVLTYPDVTSCGTATAESLPCMFSQLGRGQYSKAKAAEEENVLDVLKRVGVNVLWRDNNSGCKGVCARVETELIPAQTVSEFCVSGECRDEILLQALDHEVPAPGVASLLVLHQKGSHGPAYFRRYPDKFRAFVPDCRSDDVQTCTQQEIVNAYDNSILYTDHVLSALIAKLKTRQDQMDSVLIYISDHGESLGENGIYLHGLPYAIAPMGQKHVPMLAWFSSGAMQAFDLDLSCVQKNRLDTYSHDNLFPTLLGLFDVQTAAYSPGADVFAACRHAPAT